MIRIAMAQTAAGPDREENVVKGLAWVERAAERGAGLVVFPEMAFSRFFPAHPEEPKFFEWAEPVPGPTTERFAAKARETGVAVVLNLYEIDERGRRFDSSPVIGPDGELLGRSRMIHIADEPGYREKFYYTPGDTGFPVYEIGGARFGIAICYDRHFPEQMRALTLAGAQAILVPTACDTSDPLDGYDLEMQGAAFSNLVYIATANRTGREETLEFAGRSIVVDPDGGLAARAPAGEEHLLVAEIDQVRVERARTQRPFLRDRRPELYGPLLRGPKVT